MIRERLVGWQHAFDHRVTVWITAGVAALLVLACAAVLLLSATGFVRPELRRELWKRIASWAVLAPLLLAPVLLGAAWFIAAVAALSLLCYQEYARAMGLFREKLVSALVVLGILFVTLAVADHWYHFFVCTFALFPGIIAVVPIFQDRPQGYIQRVALGIFGFMLFGVCLGHLGYMANDWHYRPAVLTVLLCTELNDVFAFCCGKSIGGPKLAPNTSPNKTISGSVGAVVLTTALAATLGHFVWQDTRLDHPLPLLAFGLIVSVVGQLGDLTLSSLKRDLGIKDMASVLPGHGGLLDRFNSLLFVSPAVFHFVGYFLGWGTNLPTRILSGP
ncbi:MAG: phosphatidate cytidylyltransferase [Planctomycetes bacterium]|nr:phosphatidate cytidylyltransferase [Planctomycetota bacterium]